MHTYQKIKKIASQKNIQQKEIAVVLGVTENTMTNYLTGRTKIDADQIPLFAKALKVSIAEIYSGLELNKEDHMECNCEEKDRQISDLEKEVQGLKDKCIVLQDKYTECLEKLLAKKESNPSNSAQVG